MRTETPQTILEPPEQKSKPADTRQNGERKEERVEEI
jgi:hypothetical protein